MTDKEIIERLGGSAALARKLGFTGQNGTIRVSNWKKRGIPALIRLTNPSIFNKKEFKNCADQP